MKKITKVLAAGLLVVSSITAFALTNDATMKGETPLDPLAAGSEYSTLTVILPTPIVNPATPVNSMEPVTPATPVPQPLNPAIIIIKPIPGQPLDLTRLDKKSALYVEELLMKKGVIDSGGVVVENSSIKKIKIMPAKAE